jgi:A118 family predicted phage portal protein
MAFRVNDITSALMRKAIDDWFELYYRQEVTEQADSCKQIPHTIVRKLTKTVFAEYQAQSKDEFAEGVLTALGRKQMEAMQLALIGGESFIKPLPSKNGFRFTVIPRSEVLVFGRDESGNVTDMGTTAVTVHDKWYYTLLERRTVDAGGYLTIQNKLYRSYSDTQLGQPVPLSTLPEYEVLPEKHTFREPVGSVGLISVRTPIVNCVDGSADAVSVYAAAVGLIRSIDRNMAQLNGEFERGKSRIIVSADMMRKDKNGRFVFDDTTFVGLDDDPENIGVTIFSPVLREQSYLAREQELLRSIENVIGLKRGLLSEVEASERTATEITSTQGEYNLTIIDFQRMWEEAVREALRVCSVLGRLYRIVGAHEVAEDAVAVCWGNGILYDEEKVRARMLSEVQAGLLQPERYLGHVYELPCDTAPQRARIRKDYMPEVEGEPEEEA